MLGKQAAPQPRRAREMRKTVTITAILVVTLAVIAAAMPYGVPIFTKVGKITAVDDTAKTFTCHEKTGDTTYKTKVGSPDATGFGIRNETIFWLGKEKASWADLKVGGWARVTAHDEGGDKVADKVEIRFHQPK